MFFILSKVLNFLTNPLIFVFGCLAVSVLAKKDHLKKRFFWSGFVLLLFFSNDFIANEAMRAWEIKPTPYAAVTRVYDWGIVLTGVTANDREPADRVYFNHGADRVTHTIQLYKKGIIRKILVAGGSGRLLATARPEADEVFDVLVLAGVPAEDIVLENQSRNTHESAVKVKTMLGDTAGSSLLITSAFHMRRAYGCFNKAGLTPDIFSTDFYTHTRQFTPDVLLVPKADAINIWQKLFKEWVGIIAYRVAGYV